MKTLLYNLVSDKLSKAFIEKFLSENNFIRKIIVIRINGLEICLPSKDIELVYIDYEKILFGDCESYQPTSTIDLLEVNYKVLFLSLKMMDRLGLYRNDSSNKRFNDLFSHFSYLTYIVEYFKIDIAIFQNLPHEIYDYILYHILKFNNKKTFYFLQNQYEQFYEINESIEDAYSLKNYKINPSIIKPDVSSEVKALYNNMRDENYDPFYMSIVKNKFLDRIKVKLDFLKREKPNIFYLLITKLIIKIKQIKTSSFLNKILVKADLNKKYIFIPLHFQPEMTTSPRGGIFVFQELMIEMISKYAPKDLTIYIKEHPAQNLTYGRSIDFYRKITSYPNTFIVDESVNSFKLMKNAQVLAIVTGTLGFKAICNQKPVFVFGEVFYKYAPGVFAIKTGDDLKKAFIKLKHIKISQSITLNYLEAIKGNFYKGYSDNQYGKISDLNFNSNIESLVENISDRIGVIHDSSLKLDD